jgi:N-methylhydantoinase A
VIQNGEPEITHEFEVGHVHRFKRGSGYPLQISAIELLEIGAGGGSIAYVNELGLLKVGPQSAGAAPGPVCYGRGGQQPTVTDADLILGYLDPGHFLGGDMTLDVDAAKAAISQDIQTQLGMTVEQIAWGIHDVVNESMAAATRAHAAEKGIDVRNFAMIAFGGAGPVHAYALARKLGLRQILCPFGAGVASAIGCLAAMPAVELVSPHFALLDDIDWAEVSNLYEGMRRSGEVALTKLVGDNSTLVMQRSIDMRCDGQGYSVTVPVSSATAQISADDLRASFGDIYQGVYGHRPPDVPLEIVALRARVLNPRPKLAIAPAEAAAADSAGAMKGRRSVYFEASDGYVETAIYDRGQLPLGTIYEGPAIIEERETSIIAGPDTTFHLDPAANLIIDFRD